MQLEHPKVYKTIGIHPKMADKQVYLQINYFAISRRVAVGECGLDYTKSSTITLQRKIFEEQVRLSQIYSKPLVLHLRATSKDLHKTLMVYQEALDILKKLGINHMHYMHLHCYLGDASFLVRWLIEYPNTVIEITQRLVGLPHGEQTIRLVKLNQMVIETDAPHLISPTLSKAPGNSPFFLPTLATVVGQI